MKKVTVDKNVVYGIKIRTNNSNEKNNETAKIGKLCQSFYPSLFMKAEKPSVAFGVYTNYESDQNGDFDVIASIENPHSQDGLEKIEIQSGLYMLFEKVGEMPNSVIEAWQDVWTYFSSDSCKDKRLFKTDFETYVDDKSVKVYIGIQ